MTVKKPRKRIPHDSHRESNSILERLLENSETNFDAFNAAEIKKRQSKKRRMLK